MNVPTLSLATIVAIDLGPMVLVGAMFLIPQLVGYVLFWWWSRRQWSGARLVGVLAPPITLIVPYVLLMVIGRLFVPAPVGPETGDYDPVSPLIAILAGIHMGVAILAQGVGWLLEPSIDDVRVAPDIESRRPN